MFAVEPPHVGDVRLSATGNRQVPQIFAIGASNGRASKLQFVTAEEEIAIRLPRVIESNRVVSGRP